MLNVLSHSNEVSILTPNIKQGIRRTKIVATVGPACADPKTLQTLIREGADVLRINSSHTSPQGVGEWIMRIRHAAQKVKKHAAILVDLQGPRIRTGPLAGHRPVNLKKDDRVMIMPGALPGYINGMHRLATDCAVFPSLVKKNDPVFFDNGLLDLRVIQVAKKFVICEVLSGGVLGENKGINLPQAPMSLPALSEKDRGVVRVAAKLGVDAIALSFVRTAEDILQVQAYLAHFKKNIPVIAKIEKPRAVEQIDAILKVSDGIMVARGDLGIEMGVDKVPVIQKKLIGLANLGNRSVITATQMLESMMEQTRPSRAEASDIANAVFDGTDAVMLSGETAVGKHPVACIRMMAKIICEAEKYREFEITPERHLCGNKKHPICAITHAAQNAATSLDAKAIVAFTVSGETAILVSKFERRLPVLALTPSDAVCRKMSFYRGVHPLKIEYGRHPGHMLVRMEKAILNSKILQKGDAVVIVAGKCALLGAGFMVKLHWLGGNSK